MNRMKIVLMLLLIGILIAFTMFELEQMSKRTHQSMPLDVFVGIDMAYDDVEDARILIDRVKDYTNLFGVGCSAITYNETKLDATCQYINEAGLYFFLYFHPTDEFDQPQWLDRAQQKFGNRFLGLYAFDEIGGYQVDHGRWMLVEEAENYTDAADKYVDRLNEYLEDYYENYMHKGDLKLITADYALYWFTYNSLCDVVLGEYAWNHSRPLHTALVRGAATAHNKEWGVMITWTYRHLPYIEPADQLYEDMVLAYLSGAKYIVVFNYPKEGPYGILTDEHFNALKRFWCYVQSNPRRSEGTKRELAYVLPKDYGWGFRWPTDKIWGLWDADELSEKLWNDINHLLNVHGHRMDIIYDDPQRYNEILPNYSKLIFWNGTVIE